MKTLIYAFHFTCLPAIFSVPSQPCLAQPGTVHGWVKDSKGNPLAGASITIKEKQAGTTTNRKGYFTLKVPPGKYKLLISFVEHAVQEERISVRSGAFTKQNFTVTEIYKQYREVVVVCPSSKRSQVTTRNALVDDSAGKDTMAIQGFENEKLKIKASSLNRAHNPVFSNPFKVFEPGEKIRLTAPSFITFSNKQCKADNKPTFRISIGYIIQPHPSMPFLPAGTGTGGWLKTGIAQFVPDITGYIPYKQSSTSFQLNIQKK